MRAWRLIPYLLLTALTTIIAGALVLALSVSPPLADPIVHQAARATLAAPTLTALSTQTAGSFGSIGGTRRLTYTAPDRVIGITVSGNKADLSTLFNVSGPTALAWLSPISQLLKINGFVMTDQTFVGRLPLSALLPNFPELSHTSLRVVVRLERGYVKSVNESVRLSVSGRSVLVTEHFEVLIVGRPVRSK